MQQEPAVGIAGSRNSSQRSSVASVHQESSVQEPAAADNSVRQSAVEGNPLSNQQRVKDAFVAAGNGIANVARSATKSSLRTAVTVGTSVAAVALTVYAAGCAKDCEHIPNAMSHMMGNIMQTNANALYAIMGATTSVTSGLVAGSAQKLYGRFHKPATAEQTGLLDNSVAAEQVLDRSEATATATTV
ncbi:MAG: hypothetical protein COY58_03645 [Gammaproteobacteria bacterium CG_4_10_14_0_8_um_filter_38_16]|nr:MAG: hypothetical protein COY58_03645 [Gammaproteobacteria bacterium CG_4_10_14_0_8_um_filter_38_16]PJA03675.1 MAG: hypothetical protein COX72_04030 [Gammaproteobacteria bacterium CG_4_10_14_0_2_um_filter_38_22]PJB11341.1 MAG: hypothetical protein CO120_00835 [Gammaproteobacteria bacterium CG_4_9_14_3_um_filter_38_9]